MKNEMQSPMEKKNQETKNVVNLSFECLLAANIY